MTEDEKKMLEEEFRKAGSVPALLEAMARSETMEFRDLRRQVEQGPDHPTGDELYDYVLGWLDKEESLLVMDHLLLCSTCLREVLKIRSIEEALTEDALARADRVPVFERIRRFFSKASLESSIYAPALAAVRGEGQEPQEHRYKPGTELAISAEAPGDGYVTVFYGCEETGKVELVFPLHSSDDPQVAEAQEKWSPLRTVQGPPGRHWFKVFWTRPLLIDRAAFPLAEPEEHEQVSADFFDALETLDEEDWAEETLEYTVLPE